MEFYTDQDFNYTNTLMNLDCFFNNNFPANDISIKDYNTSLTCTDEQTLITSSSFGDEIEFSPHNFNKINTNPTFPIPSCFAHDDDHSYDSSMFALEDGIDFASLLGSDGLQNPSYSEPSCKLEPNVQEIPYEFKVGLFPEIEKKSKAKTKAINNGRPSKNLMAERRRRKRLNDRLSMLRSVVPKISKMDRTSILGDTIDYMKELLERISNLQEEIDIGSGQLSLFKDVKPNEVRVRNSPKFDVERRKEDTRIDICCAARPGLLLSTVTTLEALGLDIQHCVISCFNNDFALQASCCFELEKILLLDADDMKQALFRNAGYGGRLTIELINQNKN